MDKRLYKAVSTINDNVDSAHIYDTGDIEEHIQEKLLEQFLDGEIDEEEYMSKMSQTETKQQLEENVTDAKAEKYEELQERFVNDEISEEEMEQEMDRLFESGDDFLDGDVNTSLSYIERVGGTVGVILDKISYYAAPLCFLLPFVAVVLIPTINPMMAVVSAPALFALGGLLYGSLWSHRNF